MSKMPLVRFELVDHECEEADARDNGYLNMNSNVRALSSATATHSSFYKAFHRAVEDFASYSLLANRRINVTSEQYETLPPESRNYISDCYPQYLANIRVAVENNQNFLDHMLSKAADVSGEQFAKCDTQDAQIHKNTVADARAKTPDSGWQSPESTVVDDITTTTNNVVFEMQGFTQNNVSQILQHIKREWSASGAKEREACYGPIIGAVEQLFSNRISAEKKLTRILVPGSGLSRLAWEIARRGYQTIANENSPYMLISSNYVLNCCSGNDLTKNLIYPWATSFSNNRTCLSQLECIQFPDMCPADEPNSANLSVLARDFRKISTTGDTRIEALDCVATCFFIDMANNILEFIEIIYGLLKPGGYWINLGPLLYMSDYVAGQKAIELPYDILKKAIAKIGFNYVQEESDHICPYRSKTQWMMRKEYNCVFFVCQKPLHST